MSVDGSWDARGGPPGWAAAAGLSPVVDGQLIGGRYRLAASIGQGNMGRVWRARDELLDRDVAIKEVRIPPAFSEAEMDELRWRMLREARSAARLSHPAVVTVHDVVEDLGRPWIVMQLIDGLSLDKVIEKEGRLSPKATAEIGQQLLSALAAAHALGVLHRDVKPSNVLLTRDGRAVLTDFGLAAIDGDPSLTQTGMVMGTPAFSPPERIRGEAAKPAADLWSLGATLYTAVEGQGPYAHRGGPTATLAAIVTDDPSPPANAGPLTGAIIAFLNRDPAARPSTAAAMRMLKEAADAPAESPSLRDPHSRSAPRPAPPGTPRRMRRPARGAVAAAVACLAVALSVSIWALERPGGRTDAGQASRSLANSSVPAGSATPDKPVKPTASVLHASQGRLHVPLEHASSSFAVSSAPVSSAPVSSAPVSSAPVSSAPVPSAPPPSNVNLALNRPVNATSFAQTYHAADVTDGNTTTYWEGAAGAFPQSVTVDLGSVTSIARIVLALPPIADWNSRVQTLTIYGSRTSATSAFTIVPSASYTFDAQTNLDKVTVSFARTDTRYVTVHFTANSGWSAAQLAEILIYG